MELPQLSIDNFAALCLVILTPWLYRTFRPFSTDPWKQTRTEQIVSTLLLAHTLFMLHVLLVSPPQNIFKALGLGLGAAPEHLRAKIVEVYGGEESVPQHLALLLKRLGLADLRLFYVRFGHDVLTTCSYCHSFGDFALYAFPGPLLEYIREIAFAGILTLPSTPTTRYRPLALGALLGALLTEAYWTLTVEIRLPTTASPNVDVTMWHDFFAQSRHALFLILPIVVTILPSLGLHRLPIIGSLFPVPLHEQRAGLPPPQFQMQGQNVTLPPGSTLQSASTLALQTLSHLVPTLHLFKYANSAVMRMQAEKSSDATSSEKKAPHERATQWWAEEAKEGRIVREDEGVRGIMKSAGLSIEPEAKEGDNVVQPEGPLLLSAKMAIKFLKEQGAVPSGLWTQ